MKFITAEEMMALLQAKSLDPGYKPQLGESYDEWLKRTTLLALQGLEDGSNPVISPEEWLRMKEWFRDFCTQASRPNSPVPSGVK